ncbi:MAG: hypothetical protein NUV74_02050 [Candidatus Brocadiaceae bacterium]|nr:hypothetical protein [Candidatus Brocadiaceae bacterium]
MKRKVIIPYNTKSKEVARRLRKSGTLSEVLLCGYKEEYTRCFVGYRGLDSKI